MLEHTADLRLKVFGKTLEELFCNAVLALACVLKESCEKDVEKCELNEQVTVRATNVNALLVDFLNEVLSKSYINKVIFPHCYFTISPSDLDKVASSGIFLLKGEICGIKVDGFDEDVKAVTYHEVDIKKDKKGIWQTTLVLDI